MENNKKQEQFRIREYAEIVRLIQEYSEREGLTYEEGLEKAKEKLLSERAATQKR